MNKSAGNPDIVIRRQLAVAQRVACRLAAGSHFKKTSPRGALGGIIVGISLRRARRCDSVLD